MRKHYIDNLRTLTILLLFPYHTLMIYYSATKRLRFGRVILCVFFGCLPQADEKKAHLSK